MDEFLIAIAEQMGYDFTELVEATPDQKSKLRKRTPNLSCTGLFYTDNELVITSESTYKNWLYYKGFEYIKDNYDMLKSKNCGFMVIYSSDESRVAEVLDTLNETGEEPGEETEE